MYKHKRHKHRDYFPGGMIWWFIFMMMFMKGEWWPWFLIPIGFWLVCGAMFNEETEKPERKQTPKTQFDSTPFNASPSTPKPDSAPEPIHHLPAMWRTSSLV